MKKRVFGGIVCVSLVLAFVLAFIVTPEYQNKAIPVNADFDGQITFNNEGFSSLKTNGIFILRDQDIIDADDSDLGVFSGGINVELDIDASRIFKFDAVKEIDGNWYTSKEYSYSLGESPSGVANYLLINDEIIGGENTVSTVGSCQWQLRVKSPPGKYGVRARAMVKKEDAVTKEQWYECLYSTDGGEGDMCMYCEKTDRHIDYYYVILYGEELSTIACLDSRGSTVHDVSEYGRDVSFKIVTNNGAMRVGDVENYVREEKDEFGDGFVAGVLSEPLDIYYRDVNIEIEFNGTQVNPETMSLSYVTGGISLTLPANLAVGRYLVRVSHSYDSSVIGTYVIDNGNIAREPSSNVGAGMVLVIIAVVALSGGVFLLLSPSIIRAIQAGRYQKIDSKIYGVDKKSMREREKAERLARQKGEEQPKGVKARDFLGKLADYRQEREMAREAGITMEEYREHEKKRKQMEEAVKHSMTDVRQSLGEQTKIIDIDETPKPEIIRKEGEPEFELLDSVQAEGITATEQFVDAAVRPHVQNAGMFTQDNEEITQHTVTLADDKLDEVEEEEDDTEKPSEDGGILSRIKKFTD